MWAAHVASARRRPRGSAAATASGTLYASAGDSQHGTPAARRLRSAHTAGETYASSDQRTPAARADRRRGVTADRMDWLHTRIGWQASGSPRRWWDGPPAGAAA